jgi:serine/threonine protein kinase/Flp pilus assembly protein TadD
MPLDPTPLPNHEQLLERAVTSFVKAAESGLGPDRGEWLARYPEIASELAEFFTSQDQLEELAAPLRATTDSSARSLPAAFGKYELLEEMGRGGMGVVYKARQRGLDRIVALKMIQAGKIASADDRRRFQIEANAAASLNHPHIVAIHEVGEIDRQPYFTMDWLRGGSLATCTDQDSPTWTNQESKPDVRRAIHPRSSPSVSREGPPRLVAKIARAIHHAHQHGVLHRDLKPSNILLDTNGEPRVADFGLAKRMAQPGTPTLGDFTETGELLGTPHYMAPELIAGHRKDISVAADVYGLGGIFYFLLTGRPPLEGTDAFDTMQQVREREPVPPHVHTPGVDRDLETICLKCLQKEPRQRYESALELAEDVERWLAGEPILSRPVGSLERFWRWCRRKPALAAAAAGSVAAVIALAVMFVLTWLGWSDARRQAVIANLERRRADQRRQEARSAVDQMTRVAQEKLKDIPHMTGLRIGLLEDALRFYERFAQEAADDPEALTDLGQAYLHIGELQNLLAGQKEAVEAFRKAEEIFLRLAGEFPDRPEYLRDLARSIAGPSFAHLDKPKEGEQALRHALAIQEDLVQRFPTEALYRVDLTRNCMQLGSLLITWARSPETEKVLRRALENSEALVAANAQNPDYQVLHADVLGALGQYLLDESRYADAEPLLRQALTTVERLAREYPKVLEYRDAIGWKERTFAIALERTGRTDEAEHAYRHAIATYEGAVVEFPDMLVYRAHIPWIKNELGQLLSNQGRYAEAEKTFREAVPAYEQLISITPSGGYLRMAHEVNLENAYGNLGQTLVSANRLDEAGKALAELERLCSKAATDYPKVVVIRNNLADALSSRGELLRITGKLPEAEQAQRRALEIQQQVIAEEPEPRLHRETFAQIHTRLATAEALTNRAGKSKTNFATAKALLDKLVTESDRDPRYCRQLARFLASFPDESLRDAQRALDLLQPLLKQQVRDGDAWLTLGIARCRLSKWSPGVAALKKAVELRKGGDSNDWFYLAIAEAHLGDNNQARQCFDRGEQWMQKYRPNDPELGRIRDEAASLLAQVNGFREKPP